MAEAPQLMTLRAIGLYTYPNQFIAPDGAMTVAQNVFIDRTDVVETARGLQQTINSNAAQNHYALTNVNYNIIAAAGTTVGPLSAAGQKLYIYEDTASAVNALSASYGELGTGTVSGLSVYAQNSKLDCFTARLNLYVTSQNGILRLKGTSATGDNNTCDYFGAGLPTPLAPEFFYTNVGGTQNIVSGFQYRYRVLYVRLDQNGNRICRSPPSQPTVVINTQGSNFTANCCVRLPGRGIKADDIIQVYRSVGFPNDPTNPTTTLTATEELQLATEYVITSGDISAATPSYVTIVDSALDAQLGAFLYTNPNTGGGADAAEYPPPLANAACMFKNVAFYANTRERPTAAWQVASINSYNWTNTGKITIDNVSTTYTATCTGSIPTPYYSYTSAGNGTFANTSPPEAGYAIAQVLSANNPDVQIYWIGTVTSSVVASATPVNNIAYSSAQEIVATTIGVGTAENGTWTLRRQGTIAATDVAPNFPQKLVSDEGQNRLYFSLPNEPEAVPLLNYIEVGSRSQGIMAIIPLRNSLFCWRPDGLYRVTGTTADDISLELFDETVQLTHENSVRKAGNQLFGATSRGIVRVTETGAQIISGVIEDVILTPCVDLQTYPLCAAAASEAEHKYMFIPLVSGTTTAYVWNFREQVWTTRLFGSQSAPNFPTLNAITSGAYAISSGVQQFSDRFWTAYANDDTTGVRDIIPITETLSYDCLPTVTYVVIDGNNPGAKKRFPEISIVMTGSAVSTIYVAFSTETTVTPEVVQVSPTTNNYVVRVIVPRSCQIASQLVVTITAPNEGEYLRLSGISVVAELVTLHTAR